MTLHTGLQVYERHCTRGHKYMHGTAHGATSICMALHTGPQVHGWHCTWGRTLRAGNSEPQSHGTYTTSAHLHAPIPALLPHTPPSGQLVNLDWTMCCITDAVTYMYIHGCTSTGNHRSEGALISPVSSRTSHVAASYTWQPTSVLTLSYVHKCRYMYCICIGAIRVFYPHFKYTH